MTKFHWSPRSSPRMFFMLSGWAADYCHISSNYAAHSQADPNALVQFGATAADTEC